MNENETPLTDTLLVQLGCTGSTARIAEHARKLEREVNRLKAKTEIQVVTEWDPIETAPRDGTSVIVWGPQFEEPVQTWWSKGHFDGDGSWLTPIPPTMWTRVPKPPSLKYSP